MLQNGGIVLNSYRCFSSPDEVNKWVENSYTSQQLDLLDIKNNIDSPLTDYKGSSYTWMNKYIRLGYEKKQKDYDIIGLKAFLCSFSLPEAISVTRFVDLCEYWKLLWNTRCKKKYSYPGFLSTTLLPEHYRMENIKRCRLQIKILVPHGTLGAYLPEVNQYNPEFEILFPYRTILQRIKLGIYIICDKES